MGTATVTFSGAAEAIAALKAWGEREKVATFRGVQKSGEFFRDEARRNFEGVHPPTWPHIGGDKPNTVSGHLQSSIITSPVEPEGVGRYTIQVGPTAVYGRITELGGTIIPVSAHYLSWFSYWLMARQYRQEVTLQPHPYMLPAHNTTVMRMNGILSGEWADAIFE